MVEEYLACLQVQMPLKLVKVSDGRWRVQTAII